MQIHTQHREMRIALCKQCNFDCFFCHSESLDRQGPDPHKSVDEIVSLIRQATPLGFSDITFTGDEPLLRHADVCRILEKMNKEEILPDVTIVTNGSIVPDDLVRAAASYPGNLKFNVSLHSTVPEIFTRIVRSKIPVDTVITNITRLVDAGIWVKINTVILNGINSDKDMFAQHLKRTRSLGVYDVKFLELLVTPANREFYSMYYSEDAMRRTLAQLGYHTKESGLRTSVLTSTEYPEMRVELTRCTCKVGCSHCQELRDQQFDSELKYHPCFVLSGRSLDPGEDSKSLTTALEKGEKLIAGYAKMYGNDSPMLVSQEKYVEGKEEVFFETNIPLEKCESRLAKKGFRMGKRRSFELFYCQPENPDQEWHQCRKVLKYGYDTHTPNKFESI